METQIRIAGIIEESIVDGPGIRLTVFTQGCPRRCPGCHNPQTHSFDGGTMTAVSSVLGLFPKNPLLDGITLSGGEPFSQAAACAELAEGVKKLGLSVMTYTGYTWEELAAGLSENAGWARLLDATDFLVDGPFILGQKDILLKFRGSANQRILDVKESLRAGKAVPVDM